MTVTSLRSNAVVWLVRGGRKAAHIDTLVRRDSAAISWATVIGSTDLRAIDDNAILESARRAERGDPHEDLRELREFQTGIVDGDVVVMPDSPRGDVVIGVADGPYEFSTTPLAGDLRHRRTVKWLGRYSRDQLPEDVRERMDRYQRTVWRLPDQNVWLSIASDVAQGSGERADKAASSRSARIVSEQQHRDRVCSSCGLMMAPGRFSPGTDVCRDCA